MSMEEKIEEFAGLLLESPYPVFRVTPEGKLLYANEAGECIMQKWDCVVGQTVNQEIAKIVAEAFRENTIRRNVEVECMEKVFSFSLAPVRKGNYVNIYGIEVTEKREAKRELEKIQKQVIQQERLKAIGQMSSGIVHDINNALFPILGFSEILIMNPAYLADKEKSLNLIKKINSAAKHAASVISRLKDFYRASPSNTILNPVDLNKLVTDVIGLTRPKWKDEMEMRGSVIKVESITNSTLPAAVEESEIRELVVNLIFNAVDALPAGGKITISTRNEAEKVVLEIKDTGIGMPEHVKLHCFEPFFSTKGERGTGLGLAMVYGTVKRYNGTIQLESEIGHGTKFTISFPVWKKNMSVPSVEKECKSERAVRVLVVDDNPIAREVIKEYLIYDKHLVETAESGVEAMARLAKYPFDVVITDMAMPKMSGADLAVLIKQIQKEVSIILLTGFGEIMMVKDEKPKGVDFILEKPVSADKLRMAINLLTKKNNI